MGADVVDVADFRAQIDEASERLEQIEGQRDFDGGEVESFEAAPPAEGLRVDGTTQLGLFEAGGKAPTRGTLKLKVGAVQVREGRAFAKGTRLHFEGVAVVREVSQKDSVDKQTGVVVECGQDHVAVVTDIVVSSAGVDGDAA